MPQTFVGRATPLSQAALDQAMDVLGTGLPELWSVISVETSGCGFLPDRRPKILFERHIFHRLTKGKFSASNGDISNPKAGGYIGGAAEYARMNKARTLNATAALQSVSWGLGQVLGENAQSVGFATVDDMATAMTESEDAHLKAMAAFIKNAKIDRALRQHDWTAFAVRYNGPKQKGYDTKLAEFHQRWSAGPLPDLKVRAAQVMLTYLKFKPGAIDGLPGRKTREAIEAFQVAQGMTKTGQVDDATLNGMNAAVAAL